MPVAALCAVIVVFIIFLGGFNLVFSLFALGLFVTILFACGNIRLFFLWGLILTAPFELNASFMVIPHIGGAASISFDAVDIFIFALLIFLIRDFSIGYRTNMRFPKVLYWWIGLGVLGVITMLIGPMRAVAGLEVFRMIKLMLLFIVIVNEVVRVKQIEQVVAALMIAVALQSIVALLQYTLNLNLGAQILGEVTEAAAEYTSQATYGLDAQGFTYRVGGLIGHPNLLAMFLAMLMPIGISILFSEIRPLYKFLIAITLMMGIVALVLTLSRSGWIAFMLAFVTLMAVSFTHSKLKRKYVFARLSIIVAIVVLVMALSGPIFKRLTQSDEGAVSFRFEFMEIAMRMAVDKPILGHGLNSFVWHMHPYSIWETLAGVQGNFDSIADWPVVHNIYLLVWSEQGTLGLILYLGFYFHLMRISLRGIGTYKEPFLALVNLGCFAGLIALAVDGLASFFIRNSNCGRVFFIVAALIVAIQWWHMENTDSPNVKSAPDLARPPG